VNVWFGNQMILRGLTWTVSDGTYAVANPGTAVVTDRLGSVRATETNGVWATASYYGWGEEQAPLAPDGAEKYATYVRDSTLASQDYALQRYYSPNLGRFYSPDPAGVRAANPRIPLSWNRYSYVGGDPINHSDSTGLYAVDPMWDGCDPSVANNLSYDASFDPCGAGFSVGGVLADNEQANEAAYDAMVTAAANVSVGEGIAQQAVGNLPGCAGLFDLPSGLNLSTVLENSVTIVYAPLGDPNTYAETTQNANGGETITFNTDVGGLFVTSGATSAADTMIHELIHVIGNLYGQSAIAGAIALGWVQNDYTGNPVVDSQSEQTNNAIVNNNCFPGQTYP
jgi:RHS repeat-associated protein